MSRQSGPELWGDADSFNGRVNTFWVGGSIGRPVMSATGAFGLIPFAEGAYLISALTAKESKDSARMTDGYVGIKAGIGLVIRRVTIRWATAFPLGLNSGGRTQGLIFAFNPPAR